MKIVLEFGEFRLGNSILGAVIGIPVSTLDLFKHCLEGCDIMTMWACGVDDDDDTKIKVIALEIEWVNRDLKILVPFNPKSERDRMIIGKICEEHGVGLVNCSEDSPAGVSNIGSAIWIQVEKTQVLDWFEWEKSGMSLKMWKDKNPRFKI